MKYLIFFQILLVLKIVNILIMFINIFRLRNSLFLLITLTPFHPYSYSLKKNYKPSSQIQFIKYLKIISLSNILIFYRLKKTSL